MTNEAKTKTCNPVKTLIDAYVEVDLYVPRYYLDRGPEEHAKALERAATRFMEFVKDHRHQDEITGVRVVRKYEYICSECKSPFELMPADEDGPDACAWCGLAVEGGEK